MPTDSLTALANTGTGTDKIAGKQAGGALGFISAGFLTDKNGVDIEWPGRVPDNASSGLPVRQIGQEVWNVSFSDVGSSLLSTEFTQRRLGTGVTVSQAGGALAVVAGTTIGAEFLARSVTNFRGSMMLTFATVLSQRIANNNFAVLLADLIGEGLACTINSATSISVTKTAHGFTAANIGQFMFVGAISATAAGIPGRYAIASIPDANTINLTVASWPATGSCTVDLFGHSHVRHIYSGTTATAAIFNTQRRGWSDTDTTATINTTASPGHIVKTELQGRACTMVDMLRASATAPVVNSRASRIENLPDDNLDLHVYLWSFNNATAPATSTTWTVSFVGIEKFANQPVYIQGARPGHTAFALPTTIQNTPTVSVGNNPLIGAGTNAIGDVGVQYRANATGAASAASLLSPLTPAAQSIKATAGRVVGILLSNSAAALRSVKFFNVAAPTLGTTAAIYEVDIPPGGIVQFDLNGGIAHTTAIVCSVTSAKGLTDNTATGLAVNDVSGVILFA
jgi:hypothetical protein